MNMIDDRYWDDIRRHIPSSDD